MTVTFGMFEWDGEKDALNVSRHGISFQVATSAFFDPKRIIAVDERHSEEEPRHFCIGGIGNRIATVRFTYRSNPERIRIFGAGYWRKGKEFYEKERAE